MKTAWPSTIRTIYGDHKRMEETYFSTFNGYYFTGDGSRQDEQGFYWITGGHLSSHTGHVCCHFDSSLNTHVHGGRGLLHN